MKAKYTIGLLFLLFTTLAVAQNRKVATYKINANVSYDKIIQASITVIGNNKLYQIITDSNGHCCLDALENGFYVVIVNVQGNHKEHFDFFIENCDREEYFEIPTAIVFLCPTIRVVSPSYIFVKVPNQQIEALAAYTRGVDYRYSNTINFGNSNEIIIGKQ